MSKHEFEIARLSQRENEILNYAAKGLTDIQIAHRLSIRTSTVNSYWVRIRSKVGHRSRTELVAMALRAKAEEDRTVLLDRAKELESFAAERDTLYSQAQSNALLNLGLDALPEAVAIIGEDGQTFYVNERLCRMFGYEADEICGRSIDTILALKPSDGPLEPNGHQGCSLWAAILQDIGREITFQARRKDSSRIVTRVRFGTPSTAEPRVIAGIFRPA